MKRLAINVLTAFTTVFATFGPLHSQEIDFRAGAGVAVPIGPAGLRYHPGPAGTLSADWELSPAFLLRLDGEWTWMATRRSPYDIVTYGLSLNAVLRVPEASVAPYVLVGVGGYRLQKIGTRPHEITTAVQAGLGVDADLWDRFAPYVEVRTIAHVTSYASDDLTPTVFLPVTAGVEVPLP